MGGYFNWYSLSSCNLLSADKSNVLDKAVSFSSLSKNATFMQDFEIVARSVEALYRQRIIACIEK
jgi:hypothetical protein